MMAFIIAGFFTALGLLIIIFKLGLRRVLYWEVPIDILLTLGIPFAFAGTFSGMMTAIFAGIFVSIALRAARLWFRIDDPDLIAALKNKGWVK